MLEELFKNIQAPQETEEVVSTSPIVQEEQISIPPSTTQTTTRKPISEPEYVSEYSPIMESWKPFESGKSAGLTQEAKTKYTNLYEVNNNFLSGLKESIDLEDGNYVFKLFSRLNKKPVINGKEIDLSSIDSYMKASTATHQELVNQALELESDPSLDSETRFELMRNHSINLIKNGELMHAKQVEKNHMLSVAKWVSTNREFKDRDGIKNIIDEDGNFRTKKEYKEAMALHYQNQILDWEEKNPFPKGSKYIRTDMPNPMQGRGVYNEKTKTYIQLDTRPKLENTEEGWFLDRQAMQQRAREKINKIEETYDFNKKEFLRAYNLSDSPVTKIRTKFESRYGPSKGGEYQGQLGTIDFDLTGKIRPEEKELYNLFDVASSAFTADNGVKVAFGNKTGEIPEEAISDDAKKVIQYVLDDYKEAASHSASAVTKHPKGQITFSSITAGGEPYYAYNVKFSNQYINSDKYKGSKDNPGPAHKDKNPELLTDGITFYVPMKVALSNYSDGSVVSTLANDNRRATNVSSIEGLFTVTNDLQLRIPNGGQLNLIRNPNTNETRVSGWNVVLNPTTGNMDTVHTPLQLVPFDRATDLDWIVEDFFQNTFINTKNNDARLNQRKSKNAVFDPKILQHQYQ